MNDLTYNTFFTGAIFALIPSVTLGTSISGARDTFALVVGNTGEPTTTNTNQRLAAAVSWVELA